MFKGICNSKTKRGKHTAESQLAIYPLRHSVVNSPTEEVTYFGDFSKQNAAVPAVHYSCSSCIDRPGSKACFKFCFFKVMPIFAIYLLG